MGRENIALRSINMENQEQKALEEARRMKQKKKPTGPAYGPAPNRRGRSLRLTGGRSATRRSY